MVIFKYQCVFFVLYNDEEEKNNKNLKYIVYGVDILLLRHISQIPVISKFTEIVIDGLEWMNLSNVISEALLAWANIPFIKIASQRPGRQFEEKFCHNLQTLKYIGREVRRNSSGLGCQHLLNCVQLYCMSLEYKIEENVIIPGVFHHSMKEEEGTKVQTSEWTFRGGHT